MKEVGEQQVPTGAGEVHPHGKVQLTSAHDVVEEDSLHSDLTLLHVDTTRIFVAFLLLSFLLMDAVKFNG